MMMSRTGNRVATLERARQDLPDRIAALETRLAEAGTTAAGLSAAAQHLEAVAGIEHAARLAELEPGWPNWTRRDWPRSRPITGWSMT